MCPRCIFGTGGCKITQQNRTNCKLCRYQVWYTIRQGNVTKKCCSENYGLLKFSFDRIYWNSILPSQIPTPKMKLDWIGCFSKAVKAPAPIVNLNCFEVSPRTAMSRLFQEVLFQRCVETGMKPEKVNIYEFLNFLADWKSNLILFYWKVFILFYCLLYLSI